MSEPARRSTDLGPPVADGGGRSKMVSREKEGSFRVYYTGASGNVPFKWEARPGTPKHPSVPAKASSSFRPLTPPPSYLGLSPGATPTHKLPRKGRPAHGGGGLRLVAGLVPKILLWKKHGRGGTAGTPRSASPRSVLSSSNSSSSSSDSSGSSAVSSPPASPVPSSATSSISSNSRRTARRGRSRFSSFSSTGNSAVYDEPEKSEAADDEEDDDDSCSPYRDSSSTATLCLGSGWRRSGGFSGCSVNVVAVKRALMSVVDRVHGSGTPPASSSLAAAGGGEGGGGSRNHKLIAANSF